MKRKIIAFLFKAVLSTSLQAQIAIGLSAGITNNYIKTNINSLSYTKNQSENGLIIGVPIQYTINTSFFFKTSFIFLQKNYAYIRTSSYTGIYTKFNNTYVQLPVMAGWVYGHKKIKGEVLAGAYGAYWLQARIKGKIPNIYSVTDSINSNGQTTETFGLSSFNKKYSFDAHKDKRFEFGLAAGLGCSYAINAGNYLTIEANYFHSLTDQQKNYMVTQQQRFNQTLTVCVGYRYQLP